MVLKEAVSWDPPQASPSRQGRNIHPEVEAKSMNDSLSSRVLLAFWRGTIQSNNFRSVLLHQPHGNSETIRKKGRELERGKERVRRELDGPSLGNSPKEEKRKGKHLMWHPQRAFHCLLFPSPLRAASTNFSLAFIYFGASLFWVEQMKRKVGMSP